jgi:ribosomal protein S18 acetylase RimI-like enzyme
MVCMLVPGASGLVWPPQVLEGSLGKREIEDHLVQYCNQWLRRRGAKLAQALLVSPNLELAAPLERNNYCHVTRLWYLRHDLGLSATGMAHKRRLALHSYADSSPALFQETVLRTYQASCDCPEVNGVRTIDEIMAGHSAQGRSGPAHWWLAFADSRPVGVLLLTEMLECQGQDISYIGIVPEARRQGFGRELTTIAIRQAQSAGVLQLTLAVDSRNQPAWELYRQLGFETYDEREVYLALWPDGE